MSIYRSVALAFWTDTKVCDDFTPEDRYMYLYILTNPHTNLCGCYEVSMKQIANETGYNTETCVKLLKRLDTVHGVIRYSSRTRELLILNWFRYNWSSSGKLDKPILAGIRSIKNEKFREYMIAKYNERSSVEEPYEMGVEEFSDEPVSTPESDSKEGTELPKKKVRHKYGEYGWVLLTDDEYGRLLKEFGEAELNRCIQYIDESAQSNGNKNKWKDWNLIIRKCHRNKWGVSPPARQSAVQKMNSSFMRHGDPLSKSQREAVQRILEEEDEGT